MFVFACTLRTIRSFTTALLLSVLVVAAGCRQQTPAPTQQSVVTAEWLAQHLDDSTVVPIHIGSEEKYDEEHIPGARYLGFAEFAVRRDSASDLRNELPQPDVLRDKLEALGLSDDSQIVVYSDNERPLFATRFLFTLDYVGLGDRAYLLDGGLLTWKAQGHPVTSEVPTVRRGTLSQEPARNLVVDADWILQRIGSPGHIVVDARSHEQYAGSEEETESRQGHIPGAVSLPMSELYDQAGKIRHAAELERLFQTVGYEPGDTVVAYCVTGVLGTAATFAARQLGYEILLYDGSIEDWRADPERPMERKSGSGS